MLEKELFVDRSIVAMSTIIEECYDDVCCARDDFDKSVKNHIYSIAALAPVISKTMGVIQEDISGLENESEMTQMMKETIDKGCSFIGEIMSNYTETKEIMGVLEFSKKFYKCKDITTNLDSVGMECAKIVSGLNIIKIYESLINYKKDTILTRAAEKLKIF